MMRTSLTSRPRVPVLVQATALGTLALAAPACGNDDGGTTNTTDAYPTAGPCYHQDPPPLECASTGSMPGTTDDTGASTGMTGTGMTGTGTSSSSGADAGTDMHPTAGPCFHDPQAPECASTTDGGTDSGTATDDSTGTGTSSG